MLEILKKRFEENKSRHEKVKWEDVQKRLLSNPDALAALEKMDETGGEPDVIGMDANTGEILFADCSKETPSKRRSICYDIQAREGRKKNPPASSALEQAEEIGVSLMNEEMYRYLQTLGEFDTRTSSWILTPEAIREKGGALFCERRYGAVFTFHNGADSYYSVRGWRGYLKV